MWADWPGSERNRITDSEVIHVVVDLRIFDIEQTTSHSETQPDTCGQAGVVIQIIVPIGHAKPGLQMNVAFGAINRIARYRINTIVMFTTQFTIGDGEDGIG